MLNVDLPAHHFGPDWTISTIRLATIKLCTDIYDPQRMNPADFGDPLTFPLAPPAGQSFYLSSKTKGIPVSLSCTLC